MIVSVALISYNSSATIKETLESILGQTHGACNIELIISDDGSVDETRHIVNEWIGLHKDSFYRVEFFDNDVNQGVSKNCNIAWKSCTSDWIKSIAADDVLLENCITDNVDYVRGNVDIDICFSPVLAFSDLTGEVRYKTPTTSKDIAFYQMPASRQLNSLLKGNKVPAPSAFIKRSVLHAIGYADERFHLMEDLPLWIKFLENDHKLYFFDVPTVKYRIGNSLSSSSTRYINKAFLQEIENVFQGLILPRLSFRDLVFIFDRRLFFASRKFISRLTDNKKGLLSIALDFAIDIFRPYSYKTYIHKFNMIRGKPFVAGGQK
jgi:glycosyltransferase involved in cell wall biosynthesis